MISECYILYRALSAKKNIDLGIRMTVTPIEYKILYINFLSFQD